MSQLLVIWLLPNAPVCVYWSLSEVGAKVPFHYQALSDDDDDDDYDSFLADEDNGQFLHAGWWLWSPIPDTHTLLHFGQAKVWAEDDWNAASSFCLLRLSFAASSLSSSNLPLAFLTDERLSV